MLIWKIPVSLTKQKNRLQVSKLCRMFKFWNITSHIEKIGSITIHRNLDVFDLRRQGSLLWIMIIIYHLAEACIPIIATSAILETLTLPNIEGGTMCPPPIRRSPISSWWKSFWWHIFLLFISTYLTHSWLYHHNFCYYDRFLKGCAHKMIILLPKHWKSGKYFKYL